jgi:AraC-like DNA-binding protein
VLSLPLARYELLRTENTEHVRQVVGQVLKPHHVDPLHAGARLDAWVRSVRLCDVAVSCLGYGADVCVDLGRPEAFFVVSVPLTGRAEMRSAAGRHCLVDGDAWIASPMDPLAMRWSADCAQLVLRIERAALEARLSDLLDAPLTGPLRFAPVMDVRTGYGGSWRQGLALLVSELDRPGSLIEQPIVARRFERTLLAALLVAQRSNYTEAIMGDTRSAPSRAVSIAVGLIESSPKCDHTTASLAKEAGVTARALQSGFRKHLDMRPMEYLREVRLRRAHDHLRAAQSDAVTVSLVAAEWGFPHLGRFAARYQQRFGEAPSATLRR